MSDEDCLYDYKSVVRNADDLYDDIHYEEEVVDEIQGGEEFKYSYYNMLEELDCPQ